MRLKLLSSIIFLLCISLFLSLGFWQLDRAKELLSQSDKAINHWERRLDKGFGELDNGFSDLLAAQKKVAEGGDSSFARKKKNKSSKKDKTIRNPKKEEEE